MSIRVLVVDDQALVRAGFRMILDAHDDIEVVGEAENGEAAVAQAHALKPDVVLMDVRMPVMDGIEATRRLAGADVRDPVKVLVLTTFDLDEYVYEALRAGASGFLLKDVPRDELARGIRVIAGGEALLAPSVTRRLVEDFGLDGAGIGVIPDPGIKLYDRALPLPARRRQGPVIALNWAGDRPHFRYPAPAEDNERFFARQVKAARLRCLESIRQRYARA